LMWQIDVHSIEHLVVGQYATQWNFLVRWLPRGVSHLRVTETPQKRQSNRIFQPVFRTCCRAPWFAALNHRYGHPALQRCISPVPAPQTGISNVSTPWEGEAPAEPQTQPTAAHRSEALRVPAHNRTLPAAHRHPEPPGETAATEPLNGIREQPCDSWAIGNLGSSSGGIQSIPARLRGWRGLHSESPGIGAKPARVPGTGVNSPFSIVGCAVRGKSVLRTDRSVRDWTCRSPRYVGCWQQLHH
jgi:hypothetical protein